MAAVQDPQQVDLHRALPVFRHGLDEALRQHVLGTTVAGVGHQHVNRSEVGNCGQHGIPVGDVKRHRSGLTTIFDDVGDDFLCSLGP